MTEADPDKLCTIRKRMIAEQRRVLLQAAEIGCLPASGALGMIADLEGAIVAIDEMLEGPEAALAIG